LNTLPLTYERLYHATSVDLFKAVDPRTLAILRRRRNMGSGKRRGWFVRRALVSADVLGLIGAFGLAEAVFASRVHQSGVLSQASEMLTFIPSLPVWVFAAKLYGLYDKDEEHADHSTTDDFARIFHLLTVCTFLLYAVSRLTLWFRPEFAKLFVFWLIAIAGTTALRALARTCCRRHVSYLQNTLIVGTGEVGRSVASKLIRHPEYGLNLVGFIDSDPRVRPSGLAHLSVLGGPNQLPDVIRLLDVERVIIASHNESDAETAALIRSIKADSEVQIDIVPQLLEILGPNVTLHMVEGQPLLGVATSRLSPSSAFVKRSIDVVAAVIGLVLVAPLLLFIAVAVKLESRGPVLYRHERIGRGRARIQILKFRTMKLEACRGDRYGGVAAEEIFEGLLSDQDRADEFAATYKLADDPRVTRIGRFLRRTSLDELPQFINVLRGDVSIVGPRAITEDELPRYGQRVDDLLQIRPGVTGYWQINGRSRLSYEDRVRLDLSYINAWSLRLDLEIVAKTARILVTGDGAV
jgi:exopolysaccharide biosynthesis polyprenyl glycosylphosphotransferase